MTARQESHRRAQTALNDLWPYTGELFTADGVPPIDAAAFPDPVPIRETWNATIDSVLARGTLTRPADGWMQSGGRAGRHTEHLGHLLADMQYLQRTYPGATW